jgi:aminoglycoside 6'-N-acetyltransferase
MTDPADRADDQGRPVLDGEQVRLRPGDPADAPALHAILAEPTVACWWGEPEPAEDIAASLLGAADGPAQR